MPPTKTRREHPAHVDARGQKDRMQKLYSADHHIGHAAIIGHCKRPFSSVRQMNEAIVELHNARADKSTDCYFLGDFAISDDDREVRKCFDAMKGSKHLIVGNHDRSNMVLNLPWSTIRPWHTVKDGPYKIYLSHIGAESWDGIHNGRFHFYGHTHGKKVSHGRSIDVGVDPWDFSPVTAREAIAKMMAFNRDFDSYVPERQEIIRSPEQNVPENDYYYPEPRNEPGYGYTNPDDEADMPEPDWEISQVPKMKF
jgi:calcineurin-like phosphoesterase family protein